jgi:hypothetical protein
LGRSGHQGHRDDDPESHFGKLVHCKPWDLEGGGLFRCSKDSAFAIGILEMKTISPSPASSECRQSFGDFGKDEPLQTEKLNNRMERTLICRSALRVFLMAFVVMPIIKRVVIVLPKQRNCNFR